MMHPKFNPHKALEVLLYVAQRCPDMYTALKVVYFADKQHLSRYGRLIAGDSYVAMKHGPVPSGLYDIVKSVRVGDALPAADVPVRDAFTMQGWNIVPLREPNLDVLSESDLECLAESICEYGQKSFAELKTLSHDAVFEAADRNDLIPMEALARSVPDGDALLEYLNR